MSTKQQHINNFSIYTDTTIEVIKLENCHRTGKVPKNNNVPKRGDGQEEQIKRIKDGETLTCNPDNNEFFGERSNPLSSKGN